MFLTSHKKTDLRHGRAVCDGRTRGTGRSRRQHESAPRGRGTGRRQAGEKAKWPVNPTQGDAGERVHGSARRLERLVDTLRVSSGEFGHVGAWTPDPNS